MAYNAPYRFLRPDQRNLLSQSAYRREREVFIDCLTVLHDVASAPRGFEVFSVTQIKAVLSRAWDWNSQPLAGLRHNLEINWETADDLRACAGEANVGLHAVEYVESVIQQYQWLRRAEASQASSVLTFGRSSF